MQALPTTAEPNPPLQAGETPRDYRDIVDELIHLGTDIARMLHVQAQAAQAKPDATATLPELAIAFDRVARAVRRTILLARHIDQHDQVTANRTAARRQIIRDVENVLHAKAHPAEAPTLHAELLERLEQPDLEHDIATRPIAEIVRDICRDLGLRDIPGSTTWKRRTPRDHAQIHARAASHPPLLAPPPPTRQANPAKPTAPPRQGAGPPPPARHIHHRTTATQA